MIFSLLNNLCDISLECLQMEKKSYTFKWKFWNIWSGKNPKKTTGETCSTTIIVEIGIPDIFSCACIWDLMSGNIKSGNWGKDCAELDFIHKNAFDNNILLNDDWWIFWSSLVKETNVEWRTLRMRYLMKIY